MWRILALMVAVAAPAPAQLLPPPGDSDIRAVIWDLRDQCEVFLTIVPRAGVAGRAGAAPMETPTGLTLTFSRMASGRTQAPATPDTVIDVKAYPGMMWSVPIELSLDVDGERVSLAAPADQLITTDVGPSYLPVSTTVRTLARLGDADRVSG